MIGPLKGSSKRCSGGVLQRIINLGHCENNNNIPQILLTTVHRVHTAVEQTKCLLGPFLLIFLQFHLSPGDEV